MTVSQVFPQNPALCRGRRSVPSLGNTPAAAGVHVVSSEHDTDLFRDTLTPGLPPEVLTNVIDELFALGGVAAP